jgi:hypothetical protein
VIARGGGWHLPRTLPPSYDLGAVHLDAVAFSSSALGREAWWPAARECRGAAALPRVAGLATSPWPALGPPTIGNARSVTDTSGKRMPSYTTLPYRWPQVRQPPRKLS